LSRDVSLKFHAEIALTFRFGYANGAIRRTALSNSGIDSRVLSVAESDFPIFAGTIGKSGRDEDRVEEGKLCANVINAPIGGPYKMEKLRAREKRFRFRSFLCDSCTSSAATRHGILAESIGDFA